VVRNGRITGCARGLYLASRGILVDGVSTIANEAGMYLGNSGSLVMHSVSNDNTGAPVGSVRNGNFVSCPSAVQETTADGNTYNNNKTHQAGCVLFNNVAP
jgi:hypothetical protein